MKEDYYTFVQNSLQWSFHFKNAFLACVYQQMNIFILQALKIALCKLINQPGIQYLKWLKWPVNL